MLQENSLVKWSLPNFQSCYAIKVSNYASARKLGIFSVMGCCQSTSDTNNPSARERHKALIGRLITIRLPMGRYQAILENGPIPFTLGMAEFLVLIRATSDVDTRLLRNQIDHFRKFQHCPLGSTFHPSLPIRDMQLHQFLCQYRRSNRSLVLKL